MCAGFAVLDMERGSRLKLTGASAVWISLTSSASLEKEPTVRCTRQRTKTQVCCLKGMNTSVWKCYNALQNVYVFLKIEINF